MKAGWLIMLTGTVLLGACKGHSYESAGTASADTVRADSTTTEHDKLVKTAEINFKVTDVQQGTEKIIAMAKNLKGLITHRQTEAEAVEKTDIYLNNDSLLRITSVSITGNITVKIPSPQLDSFVNRINHMALYVNNQRIDVTDRTLDYQSSAMKLKDRINFVKQQKTGKITIKNPADVLQLDDDETDEKINTTRINNLVRYSTVSLKFYQSNIINKEVMANDNVNYYQPGFLTRITLALKSGWGLFAGLLVGLANIWVLMLVGIAAWFVYKYFKRNKPFVHHKA